MIVIVPIVVVAAVLLRASRILNLMLLGDESALDLGTDLHVYRQFYLLISSIIVGFWSMLPALSVLWG